MKRLVQMVAKCIQNFPVRTQTDRSMSMLDNQFCPKLIPGNFQLSVGYAICHAMYLLKNFNSRLALFACRHDSLQRGFVPDIAHIMQKHNLSTHLMNTYKHERLCQIICENGSAKQ